MQYDQFLADVQQRAGLASKFQAITATRATLETLAERLTIEESQDLAAQLPRRLGVHLDIQPESHAQRFSLQDFFQKVAAREAADPSTAMHHALAVMEVLCEAVSPGEIRDVCCQLPASFYLLIQPGIGNSSNAPRL